MKNNTASILNSTRVGTIPFKQNHNCACPINYPSAYSGKHINSPNVSITTDKWNTLFHLYWLSRNLRNGKGSKNSKWKCMSPAGFEQSTFCPIRMLTQRMRPFDHAEWDKMSLKLVQNHRIWQGSKHVWQYIYKIDYGLLWPCKVLITVIDIISKLV